MAWQGALKGRTDDWDDVVPKLLDAQCGYCGRGVSMQRVTPVVETCRYLHSGSVTAYVWATYICPRESCLRPTSVLFTVHHDGSYRFTHLEDERVQIPRG